MDSTQVVTVSWQALTFGLAILLATVSAATVYLRMFIKGENVQMEKNILDKVENKFTGKEMSLAKERDQDHRLTRLESAVFQSVFAQNKDE